jgi:hypothetical protein
MTSSQKGKNWTISTNFCQFFFYIQGVLKIRVLILIIGRTRQFMKLFSINHFVKFKSFPRFLPPNFCRTSYFAWLTSLNFFVTMRMFIFISFFSITMTMFRFYHNRTFLSFLMANLFHILNQFFVKNSNSKNVSFNKLCCVLELTHAF